VSVRPRLLWVASALLALCSALLFAQHATNDRLIDATATRIDAGRRLTAEQHLVRDVAFARTQLHTNTLATLHPAWVRWYYRWNPLHPGPADVLRWGSDYRGPCGSYSNVVSALLGSHGIPNRLLLIRDDDGAVLHTVVEARIGGRWVVADPSFGIVYRNREGRLATAAELAADTALFRAQTRDVPGYRPEYDYDSVTLMNWRKIPVVMPALKALLDATIGRERADQIAKPVIWVHPRATLGSLCLAAGALLMLGALWSTVRRSGWTPNAPSPDQTATPR
jgi:hypothetical protein